MNCARVCPNEDGDDWFLFALFGNALFLIYRVFQTELSQNLQQLSEKARTTTEFIQRLKQMSEKLNVSVPVWYLLSRSFRP